MSQLRPSISSTHSPWAAVIARNTGWNLAGLGLPLVVAVAATPPLIRALGTDRFGILALAWALIGYISVFDLGIGRALTQIVAESIGANRHESIAGPAWFAVSVTLGLGALGGALLLAGSSWLAVGLLHIPRSLQAETIHAFDILAAAFPFVLSSAGLRGILEANQRFGLVNAVRIPAGVLQYLAPLLVAIHTRNLVPVILALALVRSATWIVQLVLCLWTVPTLRSGRSFGPRAFGPLLRLGGWITVSNVASSFLAYADRFIIGAILSISAVAYYATPSELVSRFLILPLALTGVLFPAFAFAHRSDPARVKRMLTGGTKYIFVAIVPLALLAVVLARPALGIWLGPRFAERSAIPLQLLAIGVVFNSLAQVPFALLQGVGRPDLSARLHLIEAPLYFALAIWLIRSQGINGAALAWTIRVAADAAALFILSQRLVGMVTPRAATMPLVVVTGLFAIAAIGSRWLGVSLFVAPTVVVAAGVLGWRLLSSEDRALTKSLLKRGLRTQ